MFDPGLYLASSMRHWAGIKATVSARGATPIMEPSRIPTTEVVGRLAVDIARARVLPGVFNRSRWAAPPNHPTLAKSSCSARRNAFMVGETTAANGGTLMVRRA